MMRWTTAGLLLATLAALPAQTHRAVPTKEERDRIKAESVRGDREAAKQLLTWAKDATESQAMRSLAVKALAELGDVARFTVPDLACTLQSLPTKRFKPSKDYLSYLAHPDYVGAAWFHGSTSPFGLANAIRALDPVAGFNLLAQEFASAPEGLKMEILWIGSGAGAKDATQMLPIADHALRDDNRHVRVAALKLVASAGGTSAVLGKLRDLAASNKPEFRAWAIRMVPDAPRIEDLYLDHHRPPDLDAAFPTAGLELLAAALPDRAAAVRSAALEALGLLADSAASVAPRVAAAFPKFDVAQRVKACDVLVRLGDPKLVVIRALGARLEDEAHQVRAAAAGALGEFGDQAFPVLPALRKLWRSKLESDRVAGFGALVQLEDDPVAIDMVRSAVRGGAAFGPVVEAALWRRKRLIPTLLMLEKDARVLAPIVKVATAIPKLHVRGLAVTTKQLATLLRHTDARVRIAAIGWLEGAPRRLEHLPCLCENLSHPNPRVQSATIKALAGYGKEAKAMVPDLGRCLLSKTPYVQRDAARTLGRLADHAAPALPHIVKALQGKIGVLGSVALLDTIQRMQIAGIDMRPTRKGVVRFAKSRIRAVRKAAEQTLDALDRAK